VPRHAAREAPGVPAVDRRRSPQPAPEIDQVDQQVVDREQQEADAREEREFGRKSGEQLGQDALSQGRINKPSEQCMS
jgi:hypothetical protein